jgi:ubiquinone biosynthesis monooxygenase Coq7
MRVNHAGEVAAQGLYHGQALVARNPATRDLLEQSAREEADHLAWCETRLAELGSRPSLLQPLWYAGSFAIGAVAGLSSDPVSLGFVAETERQVERHLDTHLELLPAEDQRSRDILAAMRNDEQVNGEHAIQSGAVSLPAPIRRLMHATAKVMTTTARWF